MEVIVPLLLFLPLVIFLISRIGHQIWTFDVRGRTFEVHNYSFREYLYVDGELISGSWVGGDYMSFAEHAVKLPGGDQLNIRIDLRDGVIVCEAKIGDTVVFDSRVGGAIEATATVPTAPTDEAPTPVLTGEPDDPRWAAATILLEELEEDGDLREAATTLGDALREALGQLERAQKAAEAHALLGGEEGSAVVDLREERVGELLQFVRELHLVSSSREPSSAALPKVREVLGRLHAEREVDGDLARREAAIRARSAEKQRN